LLPDKRLFIHIEPSLYYRKVQRVLLLTSSMSIPSRQEAYFLLRDGVTWDKICPGPLIIIPLSCHFTSIIIHCTSSILLPQSSSIVRVPFYYLLEHFFLFLLYNWKCIHGYSFFIPDLEDILFFHTLNLCVFNWSIRLLHLCRECLVCLQAEYNIIL
jgi:hypothetical protein